MACRRSRLYWPENRGQAALPRAPPSVTSSCGCATMVIRLTVALRPLDLRRVAVVGLEHVLPPVGDERVHQLRFAALPCLGHLRLERLDGGLHPGAEQP